MTLPLLTRRIEVPEIPMVLSNWKRDLHDERKRNRGPYWALAESDFWSLANYVLDKITLPSCDLYAGCAPSAPETPLCWAAVRVGVPLHTYARGRLRNDAELAAEVQRTFLSLLSISGPPDAAVTFNLFTELKR